MPVLNSYVYMMKEQFIEIKQYNYVCLASIAQSEGHLLPY